LIQRDAKSFAEVQLFFNSHELIRGPKIWNLPKSGSYWGIEWEADMSSINKCCVLVLTLFLSGIVALPYCHAQTSGGLAGMFQLNTGGGYLGIQMEDVTAENMSKYKLGSERGVIVRSVVKGGPAEAANLKEDDVILEYGGYPVWSATQFSRLVQDTPPGRKVDLAISRDGKRIALAATIKEREGRQAESQMAIPRDLLGPGGRSFQFRLPEVPGIPEDFRSAEPSISKPRLGVTLQPLTEQMGEFLAVPKKKGALVVSVDANSLSDGKLKSGDVIISANNITINSPEELTQFIRSATGAVTLKVIRDKKEASVVVTIPNGDTDKKGFKL
jgi:serine protease Do